MKKYLALVLSLIICTLLCLSPISAHNANYDHLMVGNSIVQPGWKGDPTHHVYVSPSNPEILYSFNQADSDMNDFASWPAFGGNLYDFLTCVQMGARIWTTTGVVEIKKYNGSNNPTNVVVGDIIINNFATDPTISPQNRNHPARAVTAEAFYPNHSSEWKIEVNTNYSGDFEPEYIAHEFGHVIGLNDNAADGYLMYGANVWVPDEPSDYEIEGAKIMLGLCNHTWNEYQIYDTINNSGRHKVRCSKCDGYKVQSSTGNIYLEYCTYDNYDRCTYCLALRGMTINSEKEEVYVE